MSEGRKPVQRASCEVHERDAGLSTRFAGRHACVYDLVSKQVRHPGQLRWLFPVWCPDFYHSGEEREGHSRCQGRSECKSMQLSFRNFAALKFSDAFTVP